MPSPYTTAEASFPPMGSPIIGIKAAGNVSMAIMYDNSLWAWGSNEMGQLGYGIGAWWSYHPVRIMENVIAISTSGRRSYAITSDGDLWTWGTSTRFGRDEVVYRPV